MSAIGHITGNFFLTSLILNQVQQPMSHTSFFWPILARKKVTMFRWVLLAHLWQIWIFHESICIKIHDFEKCSTDVTCFITLTPLKEEHMKFIAWTIVDMQRNDEKKEAFHSNIRVQFYKYHSYLIGLVPRTLTFSEATIYPIKHFEKFNLSNQNFIHIFHNNCHSCPCSLLCTHWF